MNLGGFFRRAMNGIHRLNFKFFPFGSIRNREQNSPTTQYLPLNDSIDSFCPQTCSTTIGSISSDSISECDDGHFSRTPRKSFNLQFPDICAHIYLEFNVNIYRIFFIQIQSFTVILLIVWMLLASF